MKRNHRSWGLWLAFLLLFASAVLSPVWAAEYNTDGFVGKDEVIEDDLFLNAESVEMNGTVNGMLVAGAETIEINGTVNGDVFAFGAVVVISDSAVIEGNLFTGAANITIAGKIAGSVAGGSSSMRLSPNAAVGNNLYYGGYSLQFDREAAVGKDMYAGGYQAILNGSIGRDATIGAGAIELNGSVGRNARLDVGASGDSFTYFSPTLFIPPEYQSGVAEMIQPGLRVAKSAQIGGALTYTSPENQQEQIAAQPQGGVVYETPVPTEDEKPHDTPARTAGKAVLGWLARAARNLISLLIVGGLAVGLLPAALVKTAKKVGEEPLPAAGYGALAWAGGYLGALIASGAILSVGLLFSLVKLKGLAATAFGVGFSAVALAFSVFLILVTYGSKLVVAYLAGDWMLHKLAARPTQSKFWPLAVGVVIYVALRSVPFIGWVFGFLATVIGLGAMLLVYKNTRFSTSAIEEAVIIPPTLPLHNEDLDG